MKSTCTLDPIRYKDLLINFTHNFSYYGNNRTGNSENEHFGDKPITFYRPRVPPELAEYSILGDVLEPNFRDIHGLKVVPVVADAQGPTGTALKPPIDFTWVWQLDRPELTLSIWRPVAPPGYVSMGLVCNNSLRPPSNAAVKCVRKDLVIQARIDEEVWNDRGTQAGTNFSAWKIAPPSPLPAEVFFCTGTSIGHNQYSMPSSVTRAFALRTHLPIQAPVAPSHAPVLTGYARPSDFERNNATYTMVLPWFVITDPVLTPDQQFIQSPQYHLQRTENYVLVRHAHNNTGDVQRYNWAIHSSESTSSTQTNSTTAGIELSVEAGFAGLFKTAAKSNFSISQSNAITQGWTTSKTFTVWCTLGAYKAVGVFLISYAYRLLRTDGSEVGEGLTLQPHNSLYWAEYPSAPGSATVVETAEYLVS